MQEIPNSNRQIRAIHINFYHTPSHKLKNVPSSLASDYISVFPTPFFFCSSNLCQVKFPNMSPFRTGHTHAMATHVNIKSTRSHGSAPAVGHLFCVGRPFWTTCRLTAHKICLGARRGRGCQRLNGKVLGYG